MTTSSTEPSAQLGTASVGLAEMTETLNLAAVLSPEGKACLDGGGNVVPTGSSETSTTVSADYSCECGGTP